MNRDEFTSLPLPVALGILYDVASKRLQDVEAPRLPLPPKFDGRQYRKGGFTWFSEMNLDSLRFWRQRKLESAKSGGQYAERDAKSAKAMGYWISWRECYPDNVWEGERDRVKVKADPPSSDPTIYIKGPPSGQPEQQDRSYDLDGEADSFDTGMNYELE